VPRLNRVLVANRGEIAVRVMQTVARLGRDTIAVYSDADAGAPHVRMATSAVQLGPAPAVDSYLRGDLIVEAALANGADAVHPGYGFLSENAEFATAVEAAGLVFLGPTPDQLRLFGDKSEARRVAREAGLALTVGTELLGDPAEVLAGAEHVGYPVIVKAASGGGGIGMRVCEQPDDLVEAFVAVQHAARASFGSDAVFLERYVRRARHVEVQIFGDGHGAVVVLGDRDCSAQRRNQKIIEEAPAPDLAPLLRERLWDAAAALGRSVSYRSAGTVEFLVDVDTETASFLEVNTRLQVEHRVTEAVCGVDLVEWMVRLGDGDASFPTASSEPGPGHAIEARVYAEDPRRDFRPSAGRVTAARFSKRALSDTWIERGTEVTPFYDPLLAKLVVHAPSRAEAVAELADALEETEISGIQTNLSFLRDLVSSPAFVDGDVTTSTVGTIEHEPDVIEVLDGGDFSTVQDWPGRVGHWEVGVPPSGPMDGLSFRLANRIAGNDAGAPGFEFTVRGPTLRFVTATTFALTGARMSATLDSRPVAWWRPLRAAAGAVLALGTTPGPGCRSYLAVRGGLDVPTYLGSHATFTLGGFGGHGGRPLREGDTVPMQGERSAPNQPEALPDARVPELTSSWRLGVIPGPHAAPDYLTPADVELLYDTEWEVHFNSARTGVRLVGPRLTWARPDGGEAGLHPSNINDTPYAVGTVDFTGDMPIILGPDGPSLGGFVCPASTAQAELWKLGQLRPGDTVRFVVFDDDQALVAEQEQDALIESVAGKVHLPLSARAEATDARRPEPVLFSDGDADDRPSVTYRRAGDRCLLVEYGADVLDLDLRARVHSLASWLAESRLPGVLDITPGIRSLQIHFDSHVTSMDRVVDATKAAERDLPAAHDMVIPSRVVHLPLSWDDPSTRQATERYMLTVRDDAPWCPHNLEFIRRINGLDSIDDVHRIVFDASYLVLGLGDVYLGAPVATPTDPRHRLVTTKYNPARTWTPENAVGIGGAYLCIYGMEGPGGYQFVGRTVPVWNTWRTTKEFAPDRPWLLRHFDQIRFHPVGADELLELRRDLLVGRVELEIEDTVFDLAAHHRFLDAIATDAESFGHRQRAAFAEERRRWEDAGEFARAERAGAAPSRAESARPTADVPDGAELVTAPVAGSVWRAELTLGQVVEEGTPLIHLEAMKMESVVRSPRAGTVVALLCEAGQVVDAGQALVALRLNGSRSR
jgi:urea carboxylase